MLYGLVGESLWETGTLTVRGLETPYYSLLLPRSSPGSRSRSGHRSRRAIHLTQALQALAMSLTAVPVYLWGRRFLPSSARLAAVALTLAVPSLAYSGLLMSEALYYPLVAVALVTLARTLEEPTACRQGLLSPRSSLAGAVRLQALILLPVFVWPRSAHARMTRSWMTREAPGAAPRRYDRGGGARRARTRDSGVGVSWQDVLGVVRHAGRRADHHGRRPRAGRLARGRCGLITLGLPLLATALLVGSGARAR